MEGTDGGSGVEGGVELNEASGGITHKFIRLLKISFLLVHGLHNHHVQGCARSANRGPTKTATDDTRYRQPTALQSTFVCLFG